jgi:uncharacterized protein (TIGR00661 family)
MRIVYGVASEGMGHATRSHAVIEWLLSKGHEVHIFTSDRAFDFFSKKYANVYRIKGFHLVYDKNRLDSNKSLLWNIRHLPEGFMPAMQTIAKAFKELKPNVVISDFEFFTDFLGKAAGIPVVAANNISIIDKTKLDLKTFKEQKFFAEMTARLATFDADWYVIPTFFFPPTKGKNITLAHPVVRKSIVKAKPRTGNHVLVYQTTPTCLKLLRQLKKIDENFIVYGFGARPKEGNLKFCPFNDTTFIKDLVSAKAVITGGGFSLISEALYLKKPILSVPLADHFEQIMNGHYIKELKFGEYNIEPTPNDVQDFLLKLPFYMHYLSKYNFDPNDFAKKVERVAKKVAIAPDERRLRHVAKLASKF